MEGGDVWTKTTAASSRKSSWLENNSFDRGSVLYTDPSSRIHRWGQVLMNMPWKMQQKTTSWNFYDIVRHLGPIVRLIMISLLLHIDKEECVSVTGLLTFLRGRLLWHMNPWLADGYWHLVHAHVQRLLQLFTNYNLNYSKLHLFKCNWSNTEIIRVLVHQHSYLTIVPSPFVSTSKPVQGFHNKRRIYWCTAFAAAKDLCGETQVSPGVRSYRSFSRGLEQHVGGRMVSTSGSSGWRDDLVSACYQQSDPTTQSFMQPICLPHTAVFAYWCLNTFKCIIFIHFQQTNVPT